jgi:hypothetical protein
MQSQEKTADKDCQVTPFSKQQQRHIAREILAEHPNFYPTDSEFRTDFFQKEELDIF